MRARDSRTSARRARISARSRSLSTARRAAAPMSARAREGVVDDDGDRFTVAHDRGAALARPGFRVDYPPGAVDEAARTAQPVGHHESRRRRTSGRVRRRARRGRAWPRARRRAISPTAESVTTASGSPPDAGHRSGQAARLDEVDGVEPGCGRILGARVEQPRSDGAPAPTTPRGADHERHRAPGGCGRPTRRCSAATIVTTAAAVAMTSQTTSSTCTTSRSDRTSNELTVQLLQQSRSRNGSRNSRPAHGVHRSGAVEPDDHRRADTAEG